MKFERLELLAFGKFSGEVLSFSEGKAGLQLIYGANEAGKSTALRAIRALLFGVPVQSSDTFVHAGKDIRIGALLSFEAQLNHTAQQFYVVRRKGRLNTLLSAAGEPLGEEALAPLLHGVDEPLFDAMFGLNHETLRHGAQSLLALEGRVGPSLFEAGFGTAHLRQLLDRFRGEADELFTTRGRSKRLNQDIARVRQARERVTATATSPQAYVELQGQAHELGRLLAEISVARQTQSRTKSEVELRLRLLPLVAQWRAYREQRSLLGELPPLPGDAEEQAQTALRRQGTARVEWQQAEREVARVQAELERLVVDERLASLAPGRIDELAERLGSARKAHADLPKRRAEHSAAQDEIRRILMHLGYPPEPAKVEDYRLTKDEEAQVRRLTRERTQYDTRERGLEGKRKQLEGSAQGLKRELSKLPDETNTSALESALVRAQKHADLELELGRTKVELEALERKLVAHYDELRPSLLPGSGELGLDGLWGGAPPVAAETVADFAQQLDAARRELEHFRAETFAARERAVELSHRVLELERDAGVPTEAAWAALQQTRDATLGALAANVATALEGATTEPAHFDAAWTRLKREVLACDEYAARLLRDADRVAELRSRRAALDEVSERLSLRERREAELSTQHAELEARWNAAWQGTAFAVGMPRQMLAVLAKVNEGRNLEHARRDTQNHVRSLERQLATVIGELSAEMSQVGEPGRYLWESLTQFVARLEAVLLDRRAQNGRRRDVTQRLTLEREQLERTEHELTELREAARPLRSEWPKLAKRLGLGKDAGPEELTAAADSLVELFRKVDEARGLERRIAGILRDAEALSAEVSALTKQVSREAEPETLAALEALIDAHRRNTRASHERDRLTRELEERRRTLQQATFAREAADTGVARLLGLARVETAEELLQVIARVGRARELERFASDEERKIIAQGEGEGLAELVQSCEGQHSVALHSERAKLQDELTALEARWEEHTKAKVAIDQRLAQLGEGAAKAAEELESELATLQASVRRYLRLKLATSVLETEIERYRDANQGPVLGRARELFPVLTLGNYSGLAVGFGADDAPILLCTTADGREVAIDGLSDGTRDQLYLSLRLATLAQYFRTNPKMPWVLDDVLVHFDDARAGAALSVLAEFARDSQVLFFTHHARIVELAKQRLGPELVSFHELGATKSS